MATIDTPGQSGDGTWDMASDVNRSLGVYGSAAGADSSGCGPMSAPDMPGALPWSGSMPPGDGNAR